MSAEKLFKKVAAIGSAYIVAEVAARGSVVSADVNSEALKSLDNRQAIVQEYVGIPNPNGDIQIGRQDQSRIDTGNIKDALNKPETSFTGEYANGDPIVPGFTAVQVSGAFENRLGQILTVNEYREIAGENTTLEDDIVNNLELIEELRIRGDYGVTIIRDSNNILYAIGSIKLEDGRLVLPYKNTEGGISTQFFEDPDGLGDQAIVGFVVTPGGLAMPVLTVDVPGSGEAQQYIPVIYPDGTLIYTELNPQESENIGTGIINAGTNLREGPGTNTSVVRTTDVPTNVVIIRQETGTDSRLWYQVKLIDGREAWVRGDLIQTQTEPQPSPVPEPPVVRPWATQEGAQASETQAEASPEMSIVLEHARFGEPQIESDEGLGFVMFSDNYIREIMNGSNFTMTPRKATEALQFIMTQSRNITNQALAVMSQPAITQDSAVTFSVFKQRHTDDTPDRKMTGSFDNLQIYVVTDDEYEAIRNSFETHNNTLGDYVYITGIYGERTYESGILYIEEATSTLVYVKRVGRYSESALRRKGTPYSIVRDGLTTTYADITQSMTLGTAKITPTNMPNYRFTVDPLYYLVGCNEGNDACATNSPYITPTPQN